MLQNHCGYFMVVIICKTWIYLQSSKLKMIKVYWNICWCWNGKLFERKVNWIRFWMWRSSQGSKTLANSLFEERSQIQKKSLLFKYFAIWRTLYSSRLAFSSSVPQIGNYVLVRSEVKEPFKDIPNVDNGSLSYSFSSNICPFYCTISLEHSNEQFVPLAKWLFISWKSLN